uniref:Uncharacterized protein n=1 Tax=Brassica oleracea TaxID=3712 RepID=A0A3P6AM06_BRAOL|nr:unnamed protein product [Brassica oleracea]
MEVVSNTCQMRNSKDSTQPHIFLLQCAGRHERRDDFSTVTLTAPLPSLFSFMSLFKSLILRSLSTKPRLLE